MRNAKGFTLVELLIVIAIIAILAAVLIPNLLNARKRANDTVALSYVRNVVTAIEASRDAATGQLDKNKTNCKDYVSPVPAIIGDNGCTIRYINNDTDVEITATYEGGTKAQVVYKDGQLTLRDSSTNNNNNNNP